MHDKSKRKRFGYSAIKNGFVTEDQFIEAMRTQISIEQKGDYPILIGEIMKNMGFMNDEQIETVLDNTNFERFKCPSCNIFLHECPNCGVDLMNLEIQ